MNSSRTALCLYRLNVRSLRMDALHSQSLAWYLECPRYLGHVFKLNKGWIDGPDPEAECVLAFPQEAPGLWYHYHRHR